MPLPGAQNWIVENSRRPPLLSNPNGLDQREGSRLPPGLNASNAGYTREVQGNELMSTHAATLASGDNRLIRDARARGTAAGASRGGINSNLAAATGEQAALGQVAEMAAQQAGAYGTAATQNLDSVGRQRISAEGNAAQLEAAGIGASASMYNSDNSLLSAREDRESNRDLTLSGRDFQRSEREGDQRYRSGESQLDRDYTTGRDATQFGYTRQLEQDRFGNDQTARDNDLMRTVAGETYSRFLDDPETWDEYSQSGAIELFRRLFDQSRAPRGSSTQPTTPGVR